MVKRNEKKGKERKERQNIKEGSARTMRVMAATYWRLDKGVHFPGQV